MHFTIIRICRDVQMRVKLSDITQYSKGVQINGDELVDNGDYIYLNGGINPSGRWTESNVGANTVTISEGGNSSGYINYITEPFWCGAHCYYLFNGPKNTKYLYYALKSQQDRLFAIRSGACMPNIKKSDLGKFDFEFDTNEQKQNEIVATLSRVENVIACRKRELELLDDLIKARFVEMFGSIHDGKFEMKTLPEIVSSDKNSIKRGPFGGALKKDDFVEEGYLVYEQRHAIHNDFEYAKYYITQEKYEDMISKYGEDYRTQKRLAFLEIDIQAKKENRDRDYDTFVEYYDKTMELFEESGVRRDVDMEIQKLEQAYEQLEEGHWLEDYN